MKVQRYDYPSQFGADAETLLAEISDMILNGRYILTGEVEEFESAFGQYLGAPYVRGVNSGTDALIIALSALGIGPGDEVITQANTFYATVAAICFAGATPVLVDADPDSYLIDPAQITDAITERTRAILPVHLYGKPAPMRPLLELARRNHLAVIEDAAQAHGARVEGRRVGTFGDAGCFSFHPSKNLAAAGDAGAIVLKSEEVAQHVRLLRELGQKSQNHHVALGYNSKLDALQARVLSWKLPCLDNWNAARRRVAEMYRERLRGLPVTFQSVDPEEEHVYHLFQIRTKQRDALLEHLRRNDIDAAVRYPTPIHLQESFAGRGWRRGQFPVAEALASELLCLPIRPDMAEWEVEYVCDQVRECLGAACLYQGSRGSGERV